jgi:hypothetical protein
MFTLSPQDEGLAPGEALNGSSALPPAETACRVLAHFLLLVKELGPRLAQFLAAAMLQIPNEEVLFNFVFHNTLRF